MSGPDYIVEINGSFHAGPDSAGSDSQLKGRPWLAIRWRCCSAYSRIYRNVDATAYVGFCPRCARPVHINIGSDGISSRFFVAE